MVPDVPGRITPGTNRDVVLERENETKSVWPEWREKNYMTRVNEESQKRKRGWRRICKTGRGTYRLKSWNSRIDFKDTGVSLEETGETDFIG